MNSATFDHDVDAYRAALGRWLADRRTTLAELLDAHGPDLESEVAAHRDLLRTLCDAGWTRWGWPVSVGGLGGDERHRAALYDELATAGWPLPEAFVLLETMAPVLRTIAPELAQEHLVPYLQGEEMWGQGFSEPEAGSDLAAVRTRGVVDGDVVVLDGQKVWTTLGHLADHAMVLCRTSQEERPHRGLTMLWVDLRSPGCDVRPIEAGNGRNEFAEMFFDGVRVPLSGVIGEVGRGWQVAMYLLQFERAMYAWLRQAALHRILRAGVRRAQGQPEPLPEAVSALGRAYVSLNALRSRSQSTVQRLAAGEDLGPEASIDKILLSRAEKDCHDALRLLDTARFAFGGGPEDSALRNTWAYSRVTSIFGGAVEVQRSLVAERVLGLPVEARHG